MDTFRKWLNKPKADDKSLLARFYHADRALTAVASELDSFDGRAEPDRCSRLVSRLRQGQDKVLSIINRIMEELLGDDRAPRAFRAKFPEEVLQENLAGQLWFGAECLAAGSSIMNREFESTAMRPLAQAVTKILDSVRILLRDQCLRNNIPNSPTLKLDINDSATEQLYESLKIFDRLFAEFELRYVSAMVQVKSKQEYEMQELICVLFSETLQRALKIHLLEQEQVDSFDPALMFSIPRLAIITGLVVYNKGPLNMDMPADQLSEMFRPFRTILIKIRDLLKTLNKNELYQLEKLLCTNEEIHLKNISNNNNNNSSINNSQSDQNNSQSMKCIENTAENKNKIEIKEEISSVEKRNSKLSEKLKQQKDKERQCETEHEREQESEKNSRDLVAGENPNLNDCDQDLISSNSNNVLVCNEKLSTSTTNGKQTECNEIVCKSNNKSAKHNSKHISSSKFSKLQQNEDNNNDNCNFVSISPTNSISSASSSATTADISSDWTDDDDDGDDNNQERKFKNETDFPNDTNSDLVTADCATGFLIPNTNFGNLLQQNDDPLTDNIVASEDEYGDGVGSSEVARNNGAIETDSLRNVAVDTLTMAIPSDFSTNPTDNIRNNNNFVEEFQSGAENDSTTRKSESSKVSPKKYSSKLKYSLSITPTEDQPSCSRMDITDSSDESEISRTITKQAQQQSSIASTTTANSNLDTKSCDSISKSSKSSITSSGDDGAISSARKPENKNGKNRRHHHHHYHHHHHHRNCHHHQRHGNSNSLIPSSNSSSLTTTLSTDRSHTSTNSAENCQHREYRHHSRKQRSKRQHSTNGSHRNSVEIASSGDTTSSLSDGDPHEVDLALRAAGRMKFKSTENLLHRLFVCIAGVADQLQTNFASDLRQILRSVFLMNTTPVQENIKIPEKAKDSADLFEFRPSENDVIQENNAGSNQSIYSAAEEANPELDNVFINEGSLNQSADSGSNSSSNHLHQQDLQPQRNNLHTERGLSLDSANSIVQTSHQQQQQQLNEYNSKNNSHSNIERTRSLGEEPDTEQSTRKLHLLQERRRLSSQGSNSAGSESPINSSASNSPVDERSIRTANATINCFPNEHNLNDTTVNATANGTTTTSNPINVIRTTNQRRSSTSQVLSQSTTNRRNFNNNSNNNSNSNTSCSLPKPSPPAWIPDEDAPRCMACTIPFTAFRRRHHCRNCGGVFCGGCSNSSAPLPKYGLTKAVRVCRDCYVREVGT